jgi:hypothetical protein
MFKCLKIKKLRKLRLNKQYQWCKKEYQTLNEAGKTAFSTFKEYAIKYKYQHYLNNSFVFDTLEAKTRRNYATPLRSFYLHSKWVGYHTKDLNSAEYMATQIDNYIDWATAIKLKPSYHTCCKK